MSHDESKLPLWVQRRLSKLRKALATEQAAHDMTRCASAITAERKKWTTIPGPPPSSVAGSEYRLFYLNGSGAHLAVVLHKGDVLLVGRKDPSPAGGGV